MNPQPMNLDSLLLLSEVEGFVAEQSVDRFIDEEVNMAKAMQNRLEETLIKALKTVLKKLCYFQTQNSLVEISSDLLLAHYFLRGLITESTFLSSHPSFLVKAPCEWRGGEMGSVPTHVSAKKDKYHMILLICNLKKKCYKCTYL